MVALLEQLDQLDLSDASGDQTDEVWRTRQALKRGLERCGTRAIAQLRPLITRPPGPAGLAALAVLAKLGDPFAAPVALAWVELDERSALVPLGLLAPDGAVELLARVIAIEREVNNGWYKRLSAHALGSIGSDAALDLLERLLADRDWFARLGAVEALSKLTSTRAHVLRERALGDVDPRVAARARE